MNDTTEDYRFQAHEDRITTAESRIHTLESTTASILAAQAVTNERLSTISKQLENGIKTKLENFEKDMSIIKPVVMNKAEMERTIRNAIIILACGGAGSLILFVVKLYLGHGQ